MFSTLGNAYIVFIFFNCFLISFIFWLLTFIGYLFRDSYENYTAGSFYECGFRSLQNNTISFNLNTISIALFLVIYEIEFLLIVPHSFSLFFYNDINNTWFIVFILFIFVTLLFDLMLDVIKWEY